MKKLSSNPAYLGLYTFLKKSLDAFLNMLATIIHRILTHAMLNCSPVPSSSMSAYAFCKRKKKKITYQLYNLATDI